MAQCSNFFFHFPDSFLSSFSPGCVWNMFCSAVRCRYNAVNYHPNHHKRHPIARPCHFLYSIGVQQPNIWSVWWGVCVWHCHPSIYRQRLYLYIVRWLAMPGTCHTDSCALALLSFVPASSQATQTHRWAHCCLRIRIFPQKYIFIRKQKTRFRQQHKPWDLPRTSPKSIHLTHCGLATLYGDIDLSQHWLR